MGRIITPGENHHAETCTAATPMTTTASVSPNASRRFRVMNCLLSTSRNCCTRARKPCAARGGGWSGRETMMAALYPQSLPVHWPTRPVSSRWPTGPDV
jgi:hypothetical protein